MGVTELCPILDILVQIRTLSSTIPHDAMVRKTSITCLPSVLLCINLSATFEGALEAAVKVARLARWQEENREAFAAYDQRIESTGVFSAGKRRFSAKKEVGRDGEYGNL